VSPLSLNLLIPPQALVKEYRTLGVPAFWSQYSSDGATLPVSTILEKIKDDRISEDKRIAELAKLQYGENFDKQFSYRKGGELNPKTLTLPSAIARRYRQLNSERR
jgi:hypothetical protein